jgi:hypothetical protein
VKNQFLVSRFYLNKFVYFISVFLRALSAFRYHERLDPHLEFESVFLAYGLCSPGPFPHVRLNR